MKGHKSYTLKDLQPFITGALRSWPWPSKQKSYLVNI